MSLPPAAALPPSRVDIPRQCAWCGRFCDASGGYGGDAHPLLRTASHGICPPCKATQLDRTRHTRDIAPAPVIREDERIRRMGEHCISKGLALWRDANGGADAVSVFGATLRCDICGIFIGPGHVERRPR